jgi:hypothetical protein
MAVRFKNNAGTQYFSLLEVLMENEKKRRRIQHVHHR